MRARPTICSVFPLLLVVLVWAASQPALATPTLSLRSRSPLKPRSEPAAEGAPLLLAQAAPLAASQPTAVSGGTTLTLERAHRLAVKNNPQVQNIQERLKQANALIYRGWAMLLPNLSANGSITRNNQEIALDANMFTGGAGGGTLPKIVITELWSKSFGFSANIALFNARSIPLIQSAYENVDYLREMGQQQRNDLLLGVTKAYYQIHAGHQMVLAAQENKKNAEEFLRSTQARKAVGQATKIDVLRAEIRVIGAEKDLANARDSVELAKAALATLIGLQGPFAIAPPPEVQPETGELEQLRQQAQAQRKDIQSLQKLVTIAEKNRQETWMKWVPTFDATYAWNWMSAEGFAGQKDSWQLIFGASWSILEGGGRIAELQERKSKIREAQNNLTQAQLDLREEVKKALLEVQKAQRNVELAQKQVELAEENRQLVGGQYKLGMGTSLDVLNADTELKDRRIAAVLEQLTYDMAVLDLNRAVGRYHPLAPLP